MGQLSPIIVVSVESLLSYSQTNLRPDQYTTIPLQDLGISLSSFLNSGLEECWDKECPLALMVEIK